MPIDPAPLAVRGLIKKVSLHGSFRYDLRQKGSGVMVEWVGCGDGFIEADVIRWTEGVWERRVRRKKAVKLGDRRVTAEVLREADGDGWVRLLVRGCETVSEKPMRRQKTLLLQKGVEIKRSHKTLMRGKPERLKWSDESVRSVLVSRFLGNREPVSSAPDNTRKK